MRINNLKPYHMKKLIAIAFVALFSIPFLRAQESMFDLGDQVVNIGIGLGSVYGLGSYYSTTIPPISISFEKGILDELLEKGVIGVGAYLGFTSYKYQYVFSFYDYGWRYTNIIVAARGSFHYPVVDKLDTYIGLLLGYNIRLSSAIGDADLYGSPAGGSIAYSGFVGGRYYFSDKFSGFAELGYGIAYLTLGLGVKL